MRDDRTAARRAAARLEEPVREAGRLARKLGLDPYRVNYWVVTNDEMNQLIAYDGFQSRFPHWRWGMKYDRQRKQSQFGLGKAFEIVNNDDPANAFLQESNSLADQKAVITHVEAHGDFFANNGWFGLFTDGDGQTGPSAGTQVDRDDDDDRPRGPDAAALLERHAETVAGYMEDPEIGRETVERFIDTVSTLTDTIDQHSAYAEAVKTGEDIDPEDLRERLDAMDLSSDVRGQVFDEEWLEERAEAEAEARLDEPRRDVLAYLREHGMCYDEETDRAVEMADWQRETLEILRREAYYFAGQRVTKVMNEGWAAYWESLMMGEERFAGVDEFLTYADHQARVLGSPGLNPYKLGKELWEYIENTENRREVADKLLRVEGITWRNFHDAVDFERVQTLLEPAAAIDTVRSDTLEELSALPDDDPRVDWEALDRALSDPDEVDVDQYPWKVLTYEGLAERHFSLVKPQNRGFLGAIQRTELEQLSRYMFDSDKYETVEAAINDVDRTAGWDRMREVRESHNDVTFVDAFLSREFVADNDYFTYEFTHSTGDFRVASTDPDDVKKKLLLQFTNFGKPTVAVFDDNFENRGELLLGHRYNGIMLDIDQARDVIERVHELWGRPVNLMTIRKEYDEHDVEVARRRNREPEPTERGVRIRYDGDSFSEFDLDSELEERIQASDVDYDTKPDEWLS